MTSSIQSPSPSPPPPPPPSPPTRPSIPKLGKTYQLIIDHIPNALVMSRANRPENWATTASVPVGLRLFHRGYEPASVTPDFHRVNSFNCRPSSIDRSDRSRDPRPQLSLADSTTAIVDCFSPSSRWRDSNSSITQFRSINEGNGQIKDELSFFLSSLLCVCVLFKWPYSAMEAVTRN